MTIRRRSLAAGLIASAALLAGCASSPASTSQPAHGSPPAQKPQAAQNSQAKQRTPAPMSMAGMTAAAGRPTATALMVCSDDIKAKVRQAVTLAADPPARSTFADQVYTCTYTLPAGPLVLSVKHSPDGASALGYFDGLRRTLGTTETLDGLGEKSYGTPSGLAVVLKDDETLTVDATGLPAVFGADGQRRTDLANEIASDVLGCWTGDE